jgi:hypothetical protein
VGLVLFSTSPTRSISGILCESECSGLPQQDQEMPMALFKVWLPTTTLLLAGFALVGSGCGTRSPRLLQSISVTPASADAHSFPNGQVQFTAVGAYSRPPSPSPITQSEWSLSDPTIATISPSGLAQCRPGALGAVTVKASTSGPCTGTGCTAVLISATAQLSCP